jgi:hypothetical protein
MVLVYDFWMRWYHSLFDWMIAIFRLVKGINKMGQFYLKPHTLEFGLRNGIRIDLVSCNI